MEEARPPAEEMQDRLHIARSLRAKLEEKQSLVTSKQADLVNKIAQIQSEGDCKRLEVQACFEGLYEGLEQRKTWMLSAVELCQKMAMIECRDRQQQLEGDMATLLQVAATVSDLATRATKDDDRSFEQEIEEILAWMKEECEPELMERCEDLQVKTPASLSLLPLNVSDLCSKIGLQEEGTAPESSTEPALILKHQTDIPVTGVYAVSDVARETESLHQDMSKTSYNVTSNVFEPKESRISLEENDGTSGTTEVSARSLSPVSVISLTQIPTTNLDTTVVVMETGNEMTRTGHHDVRFVGCRCEPIVSRAVPRINRDSSPRGERMRKNRPDVKSYSNGPCGPTTHRPTHRVSATPPSQGVSKTAGSCPRTEHYIGFMPTSQGVVRAVSPSARVDQYSSPTASGQGVSRTVGATPRADSRMHPRNECTSKTVCITSDFPLFLHEESPCSCNHIDVPAAGDVASKPCTLPVPKICLQVCTPTAGSVPITSASGQIQNEAIRTPAGQPEKGTVYFCCPISSSDVALNAGDQKTYILRSSLPDDCGRTPSTPDRSVCYQLSSTIPSVPVSRANSHQTLMTLSPSVQSGQTKVLGPCGYPCILLSPQDTVIQFSAPATATGANVSTISPLTSLLSGVTAPTSGQDALNLLCQVVAPTLALNCTTSPCALAVTSLATTTGSQVPRASDGNAQTTSVVLYNSPLPHPVAAPSHKSIVTEKQFALKNPNETTPDDNIIEGEFRFKCKNPLSESTQPILLTCSCVIPPKSATTTFQLFGSPTAAIDTQVKQTGPVTCTTHCGALQSIPEVDEWCKSVSLSYPSTSICLGPSGNTCIFTSQGGHGPWFPACVLSGEPGTSCGTNGITISLDKPPCSWSPATQALPMPATSGSPSLQGSRKTSEFNQLTEVCSADTQSQSDSTLLGKDSVASGGFYRGWPVPEEDWRRPSNTSDPMPVSVEESPQEVIHVMESNRSGGSVNGSLGSPNIQGGTPGENSRPASIYDQNEFQENYNVSAPDANSVFFSITDNSSNSESAYSPSQSSAPWEEHGRSGPAAGSVQTSDSVRIHLSANPLLTPSSYGYDERNESCSSQQSDSAEGQSEQVNSQSAKGEEEVTLAKQDHSQDTAKPYADANCRSEQYSEDGWQRRDYIDPNCYGEEPAANVQNGMPPCQWHQEQQSTQLDAWNSDFGEDNWHGQQGPQKKQQSDCHELQRSYPYFGSHAKRGRQYEDVGVYDVSAYRRPGASSPTHSLRCNVLRKDRMHNGPCDDDQTHFPTIVSGARNRSASSPVLPEGLSRDNFFPSLPRLMQAPQNKGPKLPNSLKWDASEMKFQHPISPPQPQLAIQKSTTATNLLQWTPPRDYKPLLSLKKLHTCAIASTVAHELSSSVASDLTPGFSCAPNSYRSLPLNHQTCFSSQRPNPLSSSMHIKRRLPSSLSSSFHPGFAVWDQSNHSQSSSANMHPKELPPIQFDNISPTVPEEPRYTQDLRTGLLHAGRVLPPFKDSAAPVPSGNRVLEWRLPSSSVCHRTANKATTSSYSNTMENSCKLHRQPSQGDSSQLPSKSTSLIQAARSNSGDSFVEVPPSLHLHNVQLLKMLTDSYLRQICEVMQISPLALEEHESFSETSFQSSDERQRSEIPPLRTLCTEQLLDKKQEINPNESVRLVLNKSSNKPVNIHQDARTLQGSHVSPPSCVTMRGRSCGACRKHVIADSDHLVLSIVIGDSEDDTSSLMSTSKASPFLMDSTSSATSAASGCQQLEEYPDLPCKRFLCQTSRDASEWCGMSTDVPTQRELSHTLTEPPNIQTECSCPSVGPVRATGRDSEILCPKHGIFSSAIPTSLKPRLPAAPDICVIPEFHENPCCPPAVPTLQPTGQQQSVPLEPDERTKLSTQKTHHSLWSQNVPQNLPVAFDLGYSTTPQVEEGGAGSEGDILHPTTVPCDPFCTSQQSISTLDDEMIISGNQTAHASNSASESLPTGYPNEFCWPHPPRAYSCTKGKQYNSSACYSKDCAGCERNRTDGASCYGVPPNLCTDYGYRSPLRRCDQQRGQQFSQQFGQHYGRQRGQQYGQLYGMPSMEYSGIHPHQHRQSAQQLPQAVCPQDPARADFGYCSQQRGQAFYPQVGRQPTASFVPHSDCPGPKLQPVHMAADDQTTATDVFLEPSFFYDSSGMVRSDSYSNPAEPPLASSVNVEQSQYSKESPASPRLSAYQTPKGAFPYSFLRDDSSVPSQLASASMQRIQHPCAVLSDTDMIESGGGVASSAECGYNDSVWTATAPSLQLHPTENRSQTPSPLSSSYPPDTDLQPENVETIAQLVRELFSNVNGILQNQAGMRTGFDFCEAADLTLSQQEATVSPSQLSGSEGNASGGGTPDQGGREVLHRPPPGFESAAPRAAGEGEDVLAQLATSLSNPRFVQGWLDTVQHAFVEIAQMVEMSPGAGMPCFVQSRACCIASPSNQDPGLDHGLPRIKITPAYEEEKSFFATKVPKSDIEVRVGGIVTVSTSSVLDYESQVLGESFVSELQQPFASLDYSSPRASRPGSPRLSMIVPLTDDLGAEISDAEVTSSLTIDATPVEGEEAQVSADATKDARPDVILNETSPAVVEVDEEKTLSLATSLTTDEVANGASQDTVVSDASSDSIVTQSIVVPVEMEAERAPSPKTYQLRDSPGTDGSQRKTEEVCTEMDAPNALNLPSPKENAASSDASTQSAENVVTSGQSDAKALPKSKALPQRAGRVPSERDENHPSKVRSGTNTGLAQALTQTGQNHSPPKSSSPESLSSNTPIPATSAEFVSADMRESTECSEKTSKDAPPQDADTYTCTTFMTSSETSQLPADGGRRSPSSSARPPQEDEQEIQNKDASLICQPGTDILPTYLSTSVTSTGSTREPLIDNIIDWMQDECIPPVDSHDILEDSVDVNSRASTHSPSQILFSEGMGGSLGNKLLLEAFVRDDGTLELRPSDGVDMFMDEAWQASLDEQPEKKRKKKRKIRRKIKRASEPYMLQEYSEPRKKRGTSKKKKKKVQRGSTGTLVSSKTMSMDTFSLLAEHSSLPSPETLVKKYYQKKREYTEHRMQPRMSRDKCTVAPMQDMASQVCGSSHSVGTQPTRIEQGVQVSVIGQTTLADQQTHVEQPPRGESDCVAQVGEIQRLPRSATGNRGHLVQALTGDAEHSDQTSAQMKQRIVQTSVSENGRLMGTLTGRNERLARTSANRKQQSMRTSGIHNVHLMKPSVSENSPLKRLPVQENDQRRRWSPSDGSAHMEQTSAKEYDPIMEVAVEEGQTANDIAGWKEQFVLTCLGELNRGESDRMALMCRLLERLENQGKSEKPVGTEMSDLQEKPEKVAKPEKAERATTYDPPPLLPHWLAPQFLEPKVKHYNRFLIVEVCWIPCSQAHHYRLTTRGPGVAVETKAAHEEEVVVVDHIKRPGVVLHHVLFGAHYTMTVEALDEHGDVLVVSDPMEVLTPRMVHFEHVQFDPCGRNEEVSVDASMHGIYHRSNCLNVGRGEWRDDPLYVLTGASACYPFFTPSVPIAFWACKVTLTIIAYPKSHSLVCNVGVCHESAIDDAKALCQNRKSLCVILMKRGTNIIRKFWDGWNQELFYSLTDNDVVLCMKQKKEVVFQLGFLLNLAKKCLIVVDPGRDEILQEFTLPGEDAIWLPAASLHNTKKVETSVCWLRPDRLPDCLIPHLVA